MLVPVMALATCCGTYGRARLLLQQRIHARLQVVLFPRLSGFESSCIELLGRRADKDQSDYASL
jgi:hypothetical protein